MRYRIKGSWPYAGPTKVKYQQVAGRRRPLMVRLVALFTVLVFAGLVFVLSLPGLNFPSLDFIVESGQLSRDPALKQLQSAVTQIKVIARPEDATLGFLTPSQRSGTGFNIAPGGTIVTNHHVIADAVKITATFPGGQTYSAISWVSWPELDLAVVYLDAEGLPAVVPGSPGTVREGEPLTIIGHPLGLESIITKGVAGSYFFVSGIPVPIFDIQASIHRGNSGSPVFNSNGEVLGIVFGTVRFEQDGATETRGVAVPVASLLQALGTKDRMLGDD